MNLLAVALGLLLALNSPARAALSAQQLDTIRATPTTDARLSLDAIAQGLDGRDLTMGDALQGRAGVLVFADYLCTQLCSPILGVVSRALQDSGLKAGADFRLVIVGFNPRAGATDAREMAENEIGLETPIGRATSVLIAAPKEVHRLADEMGFHYLYDSASVRYAHAATLYVVAPDGRLSRSFSGLAIEPGELRRALVTASRGELGDVEDQLRVLCYGLAPAVGLYAAQIRIAIWASGLLTVLALGAGVTILFRHRDGAAS